MVWAGTTTIGDSSQFGRLVLVQSSVIPTPTATATGVTSDITPPVGRIISPVNGTTITSCPITIQAEASDDRSGVAWVRFWASYDGTWHEITTDSNGVDGWSTPWNCSSISSQQIILTIWIQDNAGNVVWDPGGYVYVTLNPDSNLDCLKNSDNLGFLQKSRLNFQIRKDRNLYGYFHLL